ncbi:integral membrane protein MviN [Bacteriovorax sp. BSW11_IV]|uniref:murein biosynthesis integral membrane protein MurJ n=1 Tax=Bacteriovorax sp. BSW11_IV TaxID=1353529 RepID=UPI000389FCA0|nr:murein biosynthesis integral membrane protein MurJ [Bacteriovorax sp. BSW11_IV]EQC49933.1 integral membrane protein MviN [Bacteriovorax sp. BSW11_IV]
MANKNKKALIVSTLKMAVATLSSRVLGLLREIVMARVFGASGITDAYAIAYRLPNMLRDLFAEGAFSSAFVPVFTEVRLQSEDEAKRLLWSMFTLLTLATGIVSIGIFAFAPELLHLMTDAKFTSDPERVAITVTLIKMMSPFLVFVSLAALFMGVLNTLKIFFIPALAPAFFNVIMILSIIVGPGILEKYNYHPALSLGIGVLIGGFIQMIVQVPMIFKKAYGPMGPIKLLSKSSQKILHRISIGTIGIAATQINILITTMLATSTMVGAVSWLNYAFRLFQFPVGILSVSIANSNLVHFSDSWKKGDKESSVEFLHTGYFFSFLTIIPAFALLFALGSETVHLIFERGAFTREDTQMVTKALYFYVVGLPFYGLYKIFAPTFFTLDKPKVPVAISVLSIFCNIIFCVIFTPIYGFQILALGTSLSMIIITLMQSYFLCRYLDIGLSFFFFPRLFKLFIAGVGCYLAAHFMAQQFFSFDASFAVKAIQFSISGVSGALTYALILGILGEFKTLLRAIKRK